MQNHINILYSETAPFKKEFKIKTFSGKKYKKNLLPTHLHENNL